MVRNIYGIPCSKLKGMIEDVEINCPNEETAMAMAAGAHLAGETAMVYMQNSGLLRCGDIILSLFKPYKIPLPKLLLSIRHKPEHHKYAGKITKDFLKMLEYKDVEIVETD